MESLVEGNPLYFYDVKSLPLTPPSRIYVPAEHDIVSSVLRPVQTPSKTPNSVPTTNWTYNFCNIT